jgi:hypothetical protein
MYAPITCSRASIRPGSLETQESRVKDCEAHEAFLRREDIRGLPHQVGSPRAIQERSTLMRTVPFKRTPLVVRRTLIWCLACGVNVLIASAAAAQEGKLEIDYTVQVADIPGQLFHVTTDINNINQPTLEALVTDVDPRLVHD